MLAVRVERVSARTEPRAVEAPVVPVAPPDARLMMPVHHRLALTEEAQRHARVLEEHAAAMVDRRVSPPRSEVETLLRLVRMVVEDGTGVRIGGAVWPAVTRVF